MARKRSPLSSLQRLKTQHPWFGSACFLGIAFLFFLIVCLCVNSTLKGATLITLLFAVLSLPLWFKQFRERIRLPLIPLFLMVLLSGISTFYAISGRIALYEFLKLLISFVLAVLFLGFARSPRQIATLLEIGTALAGIVSIDLISTRLLSGLMQGILGLFTNEYQNLAGVESGIRMTSLFTNANIFAGCVGIGVLLSLSLALSSEQKKERRFHLVCLYVNALSFVLSFSMGATAMIVLGFVTYLLLERADRRAALIALMAETLILTMLSVVPIAATSFTAWSGMNPIPLLCAIFGSAALCLADRFIGQRFTAKAISGKVFFPLLGGAAAVLILFCAAALSLTGEITLTKGESLRRGVYLDPGEYTLSVSGSDMVYVTITSQNQQDTMMHTSTTIYRGALADAAFTVPEDSIVVYLTFYAAENATLNEVTCIGAETVSVPLNYKLLPGFIANRLQGLRANQNAIQRTVFFADGMAIFRQNPLFGLGMGSFEESVRSIQSFYYETKYAHNHYIQSLAETGLVGLLLFVSTLGISAFAIFHARRKENTDTMIPALGAALVFMAGHAAVEFVFSYYPYLPIAFGVFILINMTCGDALPLPAKLPRTAVSAVLLAPVAIFGCFLTGNMYAQTLMQTSPSVANTIKAIKCDAFEWPDYALSYIEGAAAYYNVPEVREQSEAYAQRLSKLNNTAVPLRLAEYFLVTGQTERAFLSLEKHVLQLISDQNAWNDAFDLMERYESGEAAFRSGVIRIGQLLDERNALAMESISLTESAQAFLERNAE